MNKYDEEEERDDYVEKLLFVRTGVFYSTKQRRVKYMDLGYKSPVVVKKPREELEVVALATELEEEYVFIAYSENLLSICNSKNGIQVKLVTLLPDRVLPSVR